MVTENSSDRINKLVHNVNSSLSAISQGMEIVHESRQSDPELVDRILELTIKKINELKSDWTYLREEISL